MDDTRRARPRKNSGVRAKITPPVVLVVDDCMDNRDLFATILRATGVDVQTACDGVEALEAFVARRPPVIIMDIAMPRMDGFEAIFELRQLEGGTDTHIIVVSAFADAKTRARALEAGCDEYLAKPCAPRVLVERVSAAIEAWRSAASISA